MQASETHRTTVGDLLEGVETIDWNRPQAAYAAAGEVFDRVLSTPGLLRSAVTDIVEGRSSRDDCESYEGLDKLVLWHSPDRSLRLRLHYFPARYSGRPHHHRWSFMSRILAGEYIHTLYGTGAEVLDQVETGGTPRVRYEHRAVAGSDYFIDHSLVHSIRTDVAAVSLCLRGPSLTDDYFTVMDADDGQIRWNKGAAQEDRSLRREKVMTDADLTRMFGTLEALDVV